AIAAPAVDEAGGQRTIAQQSAEAKNKWMSLPNQVVFSSSVSSEYSDNGATIGNYAELSRDVNPAAMDLPMDLYRLKYAQSRYQTSFLGISPHARLGLIGIDNQ
ncbi:MAG: hypothetical protein ACYYK0_07270, partial [Candidatus Eutrophobiaceae bacterium]